MWPHLVLSVVAALAPLRLGAWGQPEVSVDRLVLSVVAALAPLWLGAWGQSEVSVAPSCVVSGGGAGPVAAWCVGPAGGEPRDDADARAVALLRG